ncbi:MAG: DoxX family protein, partial [Planctomycetes bacterium]|nr:DoxX family protein [Planctomycetota bacterium]
MNQPTFPASKAVRWTGLSLTSVTALFLLMDAVGKLVMAAPVVAATTKLGYPESSVVGLGIVLLGCTMLYLLPRTAVLGAILLTGYLGGAVATHVRVGGEAFPVGFSLALGVLLWGGLYLRDPRIRELIPLR